MNKGVIYKIARSAQEETTSKKTETQNGKRKKTVTKFFIKLDVNKKINDRILNLYFNEKLIEENIEKDTVIKDAVALFSVEKPFTSDIDLSAYLGKKLEFVLDITNSKIISIEETTISND